MADISIEKILISGHNLNSWVILPPGFTASKGYMVSRRTLGAEFMKETLRAWLQPDPDSGAGAAAGEKIDLWKGQIDSPCAVSGDGALWKPPKPAGGGSLLAWMLRSYPIKSEKPEDPSHTIRIQQETEFALDEQSGLNPSDFPKWSFSPARGTADAKTLAIIFIDANYEIPDACPLLDGKPGFLLLHLSAERHLNSRDEPARKLAERIERWNRELGPRFLILTSTSFLGSLGLALTDRSSWEVFAQDLVRDWNASHNSALLRAIVECQDILIRIKAHGALRIQRAQPGDPPSYRIYYLVQSEHSLSPHPGYLVGYNSLVTATLVRSLTRTDPGASLQDRLEEGIKDGISRCTLFAYRGYAEKGLKPKVDRNWPLELLRESVGDTPDAWIHHVQVPVKRERLQNWSILTELIRDGAERAGGKETEYTHASRIAREIIKIGISNAQKKYRFPVVGFGKMKVIDRQTFEVYWEIQEAMRSYLRHLPAKKVPLSLAVFGAPGGGKSFGIKQLASKIEGEKLQLPPIEVNVAQFASVSDLVEVFREVRDVSLTGKVPLVFFDEFDAFWEGRAFGWLRYFLAPMQDGLFGSGLDPLLFGHAIFVFVGGVNHSFEMFNGRMRNRDFIEAKGPDFVSRLSRHLDILGVDRPPDDDASYLIRRAVLLRDKLEEFHPTIIPDSDGSVDDEGALIDDDVIQAFLNVPRFKHGVRSLEALVRTSRLSPGNPRFHWGALPPAAQMEMHVSLLDFVNARKGTFIPNGS